MFWPRHDVGIESPQNKLFYHRVFWLVGLGLCLEWVCVIEYGVIGYVAV